MKRQVLSLCALLLSFVIAGCGGGGGINFPDFSLVAAPSTIAVIPGGAAQTVAIVVVPVHGFTGRVTVTVGSLPKGVTVTPTSLSVAAGAQADIQITASGSAVPGTSSISLTGTSGTLSHNASAALTIGPPVTTASLSESVFDFGNNLVNNTLTRSVVMVTNTGSAELTMSPTLSGDPSYSIAPSTSCGQQLNPGANCNMVLNYTPTTVSAPKTAGHTEHGF